MFCLAWLTLAALAAPAAAQGLAGGGASGDGQQSRAEDGGREYVFPLRDAPHAQLDPPGRPVWRDTPQATVESLLDAVAAGDPTAAAHTLDLTPLEPGQRASRGPQLAAQLAELLRRRDLVDWGRLPDRPDGLIEPPINASGPMHGVPRRAITLATLSVDGRDAPIAVMRMKPIDGPPVWLFSATTVRNVPKLNAERSRSLLAEHVPFEWRRIELLGEPVWQWVALTAIGLFSLLAGWAVSRLGRWMLLRATRPTLQGLIRDTKGPMTLALSLVFAWVAGNALVNPTGAMGVVLGNLAVLGIIAAITWMAARIVDHTTARVGRRFEDRAATEEDAAARRLLTQMSIGRRVLVLLAILIGCGIALSYFDVFRTIGLSLLFSAGALSVVFGIAANALLRNFLAGLQIGFAQPVRVGDTVSLSGHYGYIEDIGSVFLTMRTWDSRRLIIPYNVLLEQPILNWSKHSAFVIRQVEFTVDFDADLDALREALDQTVSAAEEADTSYRSSLVAVGADSEGLRIWALVGASTPARCWTLDCKVREALAKEVSRQRRALPRERVESMDAGPDAARAGEERDTPPRPRPQIAGGAGPPTPG